MELLSASSPSPQLDAELLLHCASGYSRTVVLAFPETTLDDPQWEQFFALVARRGRGEPLAYLLGSREFWSLDLAVSPAVLIPRPETELVVERALTHLVDNGRVLDLATGSGAIALAIASERPQMQVVATDLSVDALRVAQLNAQRLGLSRLRFLHGNWYEPVTNEQFDLIASNPPYIAADDPDLESAVRIHEPEMALIAGNNGMECLEQIVGGAPLHLDPGGWLILEHGSRQAARVRNLLEIAGFTHVTSHADLAGHERVSEGQWIRDGVIRDA